LRVFVPEDRLLEVFGGQSTDEPSSVAVVVQPAESKAARDARIANYTCSPRRRPWYPIIDVLPQTATPLPLIGLLGLGLLAVAAGLAHRRSVRR
jgi:LPXTG-motif cell wall-anchored protein